MNFTIKSNKKTSKNKKYNMLPVYSLIVFTILFIILVFFGLNNNNKKNNILPSNPLKIYSNSNNDDEDEVVEESEEIIGDRPIAVMIDNNIGDSKHAGLQESFLNYEIVVEGGLTRIMALFNTTEEVLIGPVRSSRHYFLDYAKENDAIYAHFGNSPYAEEDINLLNIDNINGMTDKEPYRRDDNLPSPHNVFTKLSYLRNYSNTKGYSINTSDWNLLTYSNNNYYLNDQYYSLYNDYVKRASNVNIHYSSIQTTTYKYDSENKYYLRYMNGKEHIDRVSNQQLHYKNIIIEYVENETIDDVGRQNLKNIGTGNGYYITNGYYIPIKWTKNSRNDKTIYKDRDDNVITLNNGNTFIQIVPIYGNVTIE